ncbi:hypothetical protein Pst134EB_005791 [Puccinia striiformis f. sp. tritici]|nr:hypothetical protein Pst134EB_005791 [Puccinia striiformis f. sp. tritici]
MTNQYTQNPLDANKNVFITPTGEFVTPEAYLASLSLPAAPLRQQQQQVLNSQPHQHQRQSIYQQPNVYRQQSESRQQQPEQRQQFHQQHNPPWFIPPAPTTIQPTLTSPQPVPSATAAILSSCSKVSPTTANFAPAAYQLQHQ